MKQKYTLFIVWLCVRFGGFCPQMVCAKSKNSIPDSLQVLRFQVGDVEFTMQRVKGGLFVMGGTREQHRERITSDLPAHTVSLDAYYIASTEVTQALWQAVMKGWYVSDEWNTPSQPITDVNWFDCQEFIRRLDSIIGMPFRLPTEAEWEFAARGGNKSKGYRFAGSDRVEDVSWSLSNAGFRKHSVGEKRPNELGLYDMTGNVSEWCSDWYGRYHLVTEPNPQGAKDGEWNVFLEEYRKLSGEPVAFATEEEVNQAVENGVTHMPKLKIEKKKRWEKNTRSIQRHRRTISNAQKWADLVGAKIRTVDDPILQLYNNQTRNQQPRWLVVR